MIPGLYKDSKLIITWEDLKAKNLIKEDDNVLYNLSKDIEGKLVFPEDFKIILYGVFKNTKISEVVLPQNTSGINSGAFLGSNLNNFTAPEKCITIHENAFKDCKNLEKIDLKNVFNIKSSAFEGSSIKDIELSKVTSFGKDVFKDCKNLQSITLPEVFFYLNDIFGPDTSKPIFYKGKREVLNEMLIAQDNNLTVPYNFICKDDTLEKLVENGCSYKEINNILKKDFLER